MSGRAIDVCRFISVSSGLLVCSVILIRLFETESNEGILLGDTVSAVVHSGDTFELIATLTNAGAESRQVLGSAGLDRCSSSGCIQILNLPAEVSPRKTFTLKMRFAAKSPGTFDEVIPLITDHQSDSPLVRVHIQVLPPSKNDGRSAIQFHDPRLFVGGSQTE